MSRAEILTKQQLLAGEGQQLGLSEWYTVGQDRIDAFAQATGDHQFIHTDPARAARTEFGGTIAHGMLTLSLMSGMAYDALPQVAGAAATINYGFDTVRFMAPVPVNSRVRGRFVLDSATPRGRADVMARFDASVEVEGLRGPVVVAAWMLLYRF